MLKVIIADDETRLCRLVQMLGDWQALDMEVVGTASNGFEAIELIETHSPDILITDIRMPGCDGLELIQRARQLSSELEIVIISGYAQFEYAQTAIRQGVSGYLLKPIKKEALMTTLSEIGERCKERAASNIAMERLREDTLKSHDLLRHRLMEDLIHRRYSVVTAEQLEHEYGFTAKGELLQIFILKADYNPEQTTDASLKLAHKKIEELFSTIILPEGLNGMLYLQGARAYGLISYASARHDDMRHALRLFLNQLEAQKFLFGSMEFTLAMGGVVKSAKDLPLSMYGARNAACERLLEGTGRLLEFVAPVSGSEALLLDGYDRAIHHAVDALNPEEAGRAANEIIQEVKKHSDIRGYEILDLVLTAGKMFVLLIAANDEERLMSELERRCDLCPSAQKLFECLENFIFEHIEAAAERRTNETTRPIRIAKQYIQKHFNEPITLDDVCAKIGFSASYFSLIFKKETGEGFAKYLTRLRIEHAKTLLQETNYSVSEICAQVGYSDLKHFTGMFKKTTNLSPGQYRKLYG